MDIEIKRKNPRLKKYILWVVAILLTAGAVLWGVIQSGHTTYRTDSAGLITAEVTEGTFNDYIRINGKVETGVIVQISALETGIVEKKWVEEGAMLHPGDIILTLRNPNLQQQILDSESQLAEKQNMLRDTELAMEKDRLQVRQDLITSRMQLNQKKRLCEQQTTLYNENLISREEYLKSCEDYQLACESLKLLEDRFHQDSIYRTVQISQMQESLNNMRQNFAIVRQRADNLDIRASHAGQLGNLSADLGQNIVAGQRVGQINILDNYKIVVNIDEHYIDRIFPGLEGKAMRQKQQFDVSVKKVYPEVISGQFRADLTIDGKYPDNIRVGQSVPIDLLLGEPAYAVLLPRGPFFQATGGMWIYVLDADGETARRRDIKIGKQNPQYYEVLEGLSPGEKVIISSYTNYGDADIIKINNK